MTRTINMIHSETGATVSGTVADYEYEFYIAQGFVEATDETPTAD